MALRNCLAVSGVAKREEGDAKCERRVGKTTGRETGLTGIRKGKQNKLKPKRNSNYADPWVSDCAMPLVISFVINSIDVRL